MSVMKRTRGFLAVFAITWFALAFPVEPSPTPPRSKPLRFGVIAEQANEPDRMLRIYAGFLHELKTRLAPRGIDVAPLVIARDVIDLSHRIEQGEVDLIAETVFLTLDIQQATRQALVSRMAVVKREQREYYSVFFTRRGGPIKKLQDLRGRTLVLQAERSTSAFAVPRAALVRHGLRSVAAGTTAPRDSVFFVLAGAELNQAIWVLNGKGDAGAFNEGDWARLPQKVRDGLVIFHQTRPLLRGLISFRGALDSRIRAACEEVLLTLDQDPAGRAALKEADEITRFERLTAKDVAELTEWRTALRGAVGH
jgi:phosphonate transport system substrate-binding protein